MSGDPIAKQIDAAYGPLEFPDTPQLIAVDTAQNSAEIVIPPNASSIFIKSTYDADDVVAPVRLIYVDHKGVETVSASDTPANTQIAAGTRYHGELLEFPTLGAKGFKIRLDGVPTNTGDISLYGACS